MRQAEKSSSKAGIPPVRYGWLVILAFLVQAVALTSISDPSALAAKRAVLAVTSLMLLVGIVPNLRWWAFRVIGVGFLLNTLALAANGGLMPVTPENAEKVLPDIQETVAIGQTPPRSKSILLPESRTRLRPLTDTIYLPFPRSSIYSVGDVSLMGGVVILLLEIPVRLYLRHRQARLAEPPSVNIQA